MLSSSNQPSRAEVSPANSSLGVTHAAVKPEFYERVLELIGKSIPMNAETIGFHGTGLATLEVLLRTGRLPACTGEALTEGHVYFAPRPTGFPEHRHVQMFLSDESARDHAEIYASIQGGIQYTARRFGLDITSLGDKRVAAELAEFSTCAIDKDVARRIAALELSDKDRRAIKQEAGRYEGIVLGIHRDALRLMVSEGDYTNNGSSEPARGARPDLKIHLPEGLPLSMISGIEVCGAPEREFVERLRGDPLTGFMAS
jgi:hypothetical protein